MMVSKTIILVICMVTYVMAWGDNSWPMRRGGPQGISLSSWNAKFAQPVHEAWLTKLGVDMAGLIRDNAGDYYSADAHNGWAAKYRINSDNTITEVWRSFIADSSVCGQSSIGGFHMALSIDEQAVYAPSAAGVMTAFNAQTGVRLWNTSIPCHNATDLYFPGAIVHQTTGLIYLTTSVYAMAYRPADGTLQWKYQMITERSDPMLTYRAPVVTNDGTMVIISGHNEYTAYVTAVRADTGEMVWNPGRRSNKKGFSDGIISGNAFYSTAHSWSEFCRCFVPCLQKFTYPKGRMEWDMDFRNDSALSSDRYTSISADPRARWIFAATQWRVAKMDANTAHQEWTTERITCDQAPGGFCDLGTPLIGATATMTTVIVPYSWNRGAGSGIIVIDAETGAIKSRTTNTSPSPLRHGLLPLANGGVIGAGGNNAFQIAA